MHILFITDNFPPETNAPAVRTYEHTKKWVQSGHQVTVITCTPNFPNGKVFDGYKNRLSQSETIDGINVLRVWSYIAANEGVFKRIIDYLSFMITSIIRSIFVRKVDIVIGTSPQFFTVCSSYCISIIKRIPWVFELRDLWPETIHAVNAIKNKKVLSILQNLELFLYKKSSLIISVTDAFKNDLISRGIRAEKICVITNGVNLKSLFDHKFKNKLREKLKIEKKFVISYIGTIGLCHGLNIIIKTAEILQKNNKFNDIVFLIAGDGSEKDNLIREAHLRNLTNIIFVNQVERKKVFELWSISDLTIVHLINNISFQKVIPSKLFEAMGMGIPLLHGVEGESLKIVNKLKIGLSFKSEDHKDLVKKISALKNNKALLQQFSINGKKNIHIYDRNKLAQKMLTKLLEL